MKSQALGDAVWTLYESDCGARWSSVQERELHGSNCNFSGCPEGANIAFLNSRTPKPCKVKRIKETANRSEAAEWFRRPEAR
jgi:hypothetical protein